MCYNQTKFVKDELYMERSYGDGLKNLNSAVILKIIQPKKKFEARMALRVFPENLSSIGPKSIFYNQTKFGKKLILNAPYCNPLLFQCRFNFGNFGTRIFYLY